MLIVLVDSFWFFCELKGYDWPPHKGQAFAVGPYSVFSTTAGRLAVALVPSDQISLATGVGSFGLRFGSALGFIIPALIFPSGLDGARVDKRLRIYDGITLSLSVICFVVFYFFFRKDKECGSAAENRRTEWAGRLTAKEQETVRYGIKAELFCLDVRLLVRCLGLLIQQKPVVLLLTGHRNSWIIWYAFVLE